MVSFNENAAYQKQETIVLKKLVHSSGKECEQAARALQAAYPQQPNANFVLARALVKNEKKFEALSFAQAAIRLGGLKVDTAYFLAQLYLDFNFPEIAAPLLHEALKKFPKASQITEKLAGLYAMIGHGKTAVTYFHQAMSIETDPLKLATIKVSLADCLTAMNLIDESEKLYVEASSFRELEAYAVSSLAGLRKHTPSSEIGIKLKQKIENPKIIADRTILRNMHLTMGRLHENAKEYDLAFKLWQSSRDDNTLKFDSAEYISGIERSIAFYDTSLFSNLARFGHPSQQPIFIVGMPRSGTTLIEQIISSHRDGASAGEIGRITKQNKAFDQTYNLPGGKEKLMTNAAKGELHARGQEFLTLINFVAGRPANRIVDKTLSQFRAAGYIHLCFPNAKFIHCVRHPADNFISAMQNNFTDSFSYIFSQKSFVDYYLGHERLMAHWTKCFGNQIFRLNYEQLTNDPENMVRKIVNFLGLGWDPNCMKFFERDVMVSTFSKGQVRSAINRNSVARWKNYKTHLEPLFGALRAANFEYPNFD